MSIMSSKMTNQSYNSMKWPEKDICHIYQVIITRYILTLKYVSLISGLHTFQSMLFLEYKFWTGYNFPNFLVVIIYIYPRYRQTLLGQSSAIYLHRQAYFMVG